MSDIKFGHGKLKDSDEIVKMRKAYGEAKVELDAKPYYARMFPGESIDAYRVQRFRRGETPAAIEDFLAGMWKGFSDHMRPFWLAAGLDEYGNGDGKQMRTLSLVGNGAAQPPASDIPELAGMSDEEIMVLYRNTAGDVDKMREHATQIQGLKTRDKFEARVKESVSRMQQKKSEELAQLRQHIAEEADLAKKRRDDEHAAARETAINVLAERFKR
jgi:hypothetical protein